MHGYPQKFKKLQLTKKFQFTEKSAKIVSGTRVLTAPADTQSEKANHPGSELVSVVIDDIIENIDSQADASVLSIDDPIITNSFGDPLSPLQGLTSSPPAQTTLN